MNAFLYPKASLSTCLLVTRNLRSTLIFVLTQTFTLDDNPKLYNLYTSWSSEVDSSVNPRINTGLWISGGTVESKQLSCNEHTNFCWDFDWIKVTPECTLAICPNRSLNVTFWIWPGLGGIASALRNHYARTILGRNCGSLYVHKYL